MVSTGAGGAEGWKGVQGVFGGHGAAASLPPNPSCCPPRDTGERPAAGSGPGEPEERQREETARGLLAEKAR